MNRTPVSNQTSIDTALWFIVLLFGLWWLPVGGVSGDGVAQSILYGRNSWLLNPNHLLYEPLGSAWLHLTATIGTRGAPDALKRLSFLAGATGAALFRSVVAPAVTQRRLSANLATAWLFAPAAVLGLLMSDETQIVQLPALVLIAATAITCASTPTWRRAVLFGAAGGLAALFYISNSIICGSVACALAVPMIRKGDISAASRLLGGAATGGVITLLIPLFVAWKFAAPHADHFFFWVLHYGGSKVLQNGAAGYGMSMTFHGLIEAVLRASYGSVTALIDIASVAHVLHDSGAWTPRLVLTAGICLASLVLVAVLVSHFVRQQGSAFPHRLALVIGWTIGVIIFAIYWDNSDDQFYFQLCVPLAIVAGVATARTRVIPALSLGLILGWNIVATVIPYVTYPRARNVAALARVYHNATVTVVPGEDEIATLTNFVALEPGHQWLFITTLAEHHAAADGLRLMRDSLTSVLQRGGTVSMIAVIDASADGNPWKYLQSLGYSPFVVRSTLLNLGRTCEARLGPWHVHSLTASAQGESVIQRCID